MRDLITFGESMIRLSTPNGTAIEQASHFDVHPAGAEANVAISASRMGLSVGWMSRLPDTPPGHLIGNSVALHGVDISRVVWAAQGRVGTYYLELGAAPRGNRIIYDRAGSAITEVSETDIDWDYVRDTRALHLTGITPALSAACASVVRHMVDFAHKHNIMISFDLNYRSKLWTPPQAAQTLSPLLVGVEILRAGRDEASALFELSGSAEEVARALHARFKPKVTVITDSGDPAVAFDGERLYTQPCYPVTIVDEIGAGDAFSTGFLMSYLDPAETEPQNRIGRGLTYGQALAAIKMTYRGDVVWCRRADVEALVRQNPQHGWR